MWVLGTNGTGRPRSFHVAEYKRILLWRLGLICCCGTWTGHIVINHSVNSAQQIGRPILPFGWGFAGVVWFHNDVAPQRSHEDKRCEWCPGESSLSLSLHLSRPFSFCLSVSLSRFVFLSLPLPVSLARRCRIFLPRDTPGSLKIFVSLKLFNLILFLAITTTTTRCTWSANGVWGSE